MRALRDQASIHAEIHSSIDPHIARLLQRHIEFLSQYEDEGTGEMLTVFIVEGGDTLTAIDAEMEGRFLTNYYSDQRYGQPGYRPAFETLEEHPTFFEMFFIQSDEGHGLALIVPKGSGIDSELVSLCERFASPALDPAS